MSLFDRKPNLPVNEKPGATELPMMQAPNPPAPDRPQPAAPEPQPSPDLQAFEAQMSAPVSTAGSEGLSPDLQAFENQMQQTGSDAQAEPSPDLKAFETSAGITNLATSETPDVHPVEKELNFLQKVPKAFTQRAAGLRIEMQTAMNLIQQMLGGDETDDLNALHAERQEYKKNYVDLGGNWVVGAFGMLPDMLASAVSRLTLGVPLGILGAAIGAGVAGAAGVAGPQAATPEEVVTVPIGTAIGNIIGQNVAAAIPVYLQGAGSLYHDMIDEGYSPTAARRAALFGALPYAAIEMINVFAPLKKLKGVISPAMAAEGEKVTKEVIKRFLANPVKYGIRKAGMQAVVGGLKEAGEEPLQQLSDNLTKEIAAVWASRTETPETNKPLFERVMKDTVDQFTGALGPTFVLAMLGGPLNYKSETNKVRAAAYMQNAMTAQGFTPDQALEIHNAMIEDKAKGEELIQKYAPPETAVTPQQAQLLAATQERIAKERGLKPEQMQLQAVGTPLTEVDPDTKRSRAWEAVQTEAYARATGRRVVWFRNLAPGRVFNGTVTDDAIFINVDSDPGKTYIGTMFHEAAHQLEKESPDMYRELIGTLKSEATGFDAYKKTLQEAYRKQGLVWSDTTDKWVWDELLSEVIENEGQNTSFWKAVYQKSPEAVQRFIDRLTDVVETLRQLSPQKGDQKNPLEGHFANFEKVRDAAAKAMAELGVAPITTTEKQGAVADSTTTVAKEAPQVLPETEESAAATLQTEETSRMPQDQSGVVPAATTLPSAVEGQPPVAGATAEPVKPLPEANKGEQQPAKAAPPSPAAEAPVTGIPKPPPLPARPWTPARATKTAGTTAQAVTSDGKTAEQVKTLYDKFKPQVDAFSKGLDALAATEEQTGNVRTETETGERIGQVNTVKYSGEFKGWSRAKNEQLKEALASMNEKGEIVAPEDYRGDKQRWANERYDVLNEALKPSLEEEADMRREVGNIGESPESPKTYFAGTASEIEAYEDEAGVIHARMKGDTEWSVLAPESATVKKMAKEDQANLPFSVSREPAPLSVSRAEQEEAAEIRAEILGTSRQPGQKMLGYARRTLTGLGKLTTEAVKATLGATASQGPEVYYDPAEREAVNAEAAAEIKTKGIPQVMQELTDGTTRLTTGARARAAQAIRYAANQAHVEAVKRKDAEETRNASGWLTAIGNYIATKGLEGGQFNAHLQGEPENLGDNWQAQRRVERDVSDANKGKGETAAARKATTEGVAAEVLDAVREEAARRAVNEQKALTDGIIRQYQELLGEKIAKEYWPKWMKKDQAEKRQTIATNLKKTSPELNAIAARLAQIKAEKAEAAKQKKAPLAVSTEEGPPSIPEANLSDAEMDLYTQYAVNRYAELLEAQKAGNISFTAAEQSIYSDLFDLLPEQYQGAVQDIKERARRILVTEGQKQEGQRKRKTATEKGEPATPEEVVAKVGAKMDASFDEILNEIEAAKKTATAEAQAAAKAKALEDLNKIAQENGITPEGAQARLFERATQKKRDTLVTWAGKTGLDPAKIAAEVQKNSLLAWARARGELPAEGSPFTEAQQRRAEELRRWKNQPLPEGAANEPVFTEAQRKRYTELQRWAESAQGGFTPERTALFGDLQWESLAAERAAMLSMPRLRRKTLTESDRQRIERGQIKQQGLIAYKLRGLGTTLTKLVKMQLSDRTKTVADMVQSIQDELPFLTEKDRDQLADVLTRNAQTLMDQKAQEILEKRFAGLIAGQKADPSKVLTLKDRRALELALRDVRMGALTDDKLAESFAKVYGMKVVTPEMRQRVNELSDSIAAAPEGWQKREAERRFLVYIAHQIGTEATSKAWSVWYASVLSGYTTAQRNIISTGLNTYANILLEIALHPTSAAYIVANIPKSISNGVKQAMHELSTGLESPREDIKFQKAGSLETNPFKRALEFLNALKVVGRSLVAEDSFWFVQAKEAYAMRLAVDIARRENFSGWKAVHDRAAEILKQSPEYMMQFEEQARNELTANGNIPRIADIARRTTEIMEQKRSTDNPDIAQAENIERYSREFAARSTFNYKPEGTLGVIGERIGSTLNALPGGRLLMPFIPIVMNVANASMDYDPIFGLYRNIKGGMITTDKETVGDKTKQKFRKFQSDEWSDEQSLRRAKYLVGTTALIGLAMLHAKHDDEDDDKAWFRIWANGPRSPGERDKLYAIGWRPYTIKIGKHFVNYQLTPLAIPLMSLGAYFDSKRYTKMDDEDAGNVLAYMIGQTFASVNQITFAQGIGGIMDMAAEKDPGMQASKVNRWVASQITSPIPNLVKQLARLTDPTLYEANSLTEQVLRQVPFAASLGALRPKLTMMGEKIEPQRGVTYAVQQDSPLWQLLIEKDATISHPRRTLFFPDKITQLTPEERYEYVKRSGKYFKEMLTEQAESIRALPTEIPGGKVGYNPAKTLISDILSYARQRAMMELWSER